MGRKPNWHLEGENPEHQADRETPESDPRAITRPTDLPFEVDGFIMGNSPPEDPLVRWWTDHAEDEAAQTVAKMVEYGSGDLVALGQNLRRMSGRPPLGNPEQAMELGCLMYLLGKVERAIEATRQDRQVKDDTWFDIAVYAKMVLAARAGAWEIGR
jgi:hypothetical protein